MQAYLHRYHTLYHTFNHDFWKKRLHSHRISRGIFGNIFLDPFNVEQ